MIVAFQNKEKGSRVKARWIHRAVLRMHALRMQQMGPGRRFRGRGSIR